MIGDNGYVVQQIDDYCDIKPCKNCPKDTPQTVTGRFWEADFVESGNARKIDTASQYLRPRKCGAEKSVGTIKFFCKDVGPNPTHDLDKDNRWERDAIQGEGWCATRPSDLSTKDKPDFWDKQAFAGPAHRWFKAVWICNCRCTPDVVNVTAEPRKR